LEKSFEPFKAFCFEHKEQLIDLLHTKIVQTNEVRRCAYLYPIFGLVYEQTKKPLALIEIGTSAGLQLLWDQYGYRYDESGIYGNVDSELVISAEVIGVNRPVFSPNSPPVSARIGIDLNPIDLTNKEEKIWLRSLIWPEHVERVELFEKAASMMNQVPVHLVQGDGVLLLAELAATVPHDEVLCIYHTHVANQIPDETKDALLLKIKRLGDVRDVAHIYNNIFDTDLHLDSYIDGVEVKQIIGKADSHGRWFTWLMPNT